MKRFFVVTGLCLAAVLFAAEAVADTYVRGYTRQDGTYVAPHYRSSPNRSYNDNWSTSPNRNPYTGQQGTRAPTSNDRPPSSYGSPSYGSPSYSRPYNPYR